MSTFWLIYWITVVFIIAFVIFGSFSFTTDKEHKKHIPIAYLLGLCFVAFIPIVNFFEVVFLIAGLSVLCADEMLFPKY